ncbi:MAG: type III-B CRISPR module RAMP protein Cmr1 [Methylococcaceae bacterium]
MQTLTATYRIVTPMFLGDAKQNATDIRPPSIKGALRFWWRALNWGRFRQNTSDDAKALCLLNKAEAELFGAAAEDKKPDGQSRFLIMVKYSKVEPIKNWPQGQTSSGYLGLGLFAMNDHKQRTAIPEDKKFTLNLLFRPDTQPHQVQQIKDALTALGLFGGLGSRSRRGFGSLALHDLDNSVINITNSAEYQHRVKDLLDKYTLPSELPPFTAFSTLSKMALFSNANAARTAHAKLGNEYQRYRGQPSRLRGRIKAGFGLPFTGVSLERRASPVFMHIHPFGTRFQCVVIYIPAHFHPNWDKVHDYVVEDFLTGKEMIYP